MKTYITRIKGKEYLYAHDKIFIAKGKTIPKTKSLGNIRVPTDISKKKSEFSEVLIKEESRLRVEHWKEKLHHDKFNKYVSLEKIEELRARLYRSKESLGETGKTAMETAFLVDFIYNSNKIEGSKVPRESVEKIVRSGTKKNEEVNNTIQALYFVNSHFKLTLKNIVKLHRILLHHEPAKHGLRQEKVIVHNEEVLPWEKIKDELQELLNWYKEANKTWYAPELAFTFHYRFERIHPFIDGNGRVGRLIMNKILKDHRYHPIIIWNDHAQSAVSAFKKAMEGRMEYYFKFMADEMWETYDIYSAKIQKADNLEEQIKFFLSPSR